MFGRHRHKHDGIDRWDRGSPRRENPPSASDVVGRALALNAIFTEMAVYAGLNMKHSLDVVERCMRLALKAQGQCRATFETLAAIKNPPAAVFARQANIAHGPQQVNNGVSAPAATTHADAFNPQRERNELLEHQDGERLDTGTAGAPGASGAAMATVGAFDWPAHRCRQVPIGTQCRQGRRVAQAAR
ncbi:MAG: hypothetical protein ACXW3U_05595, partial [Rhodoplanes sp.]